MRPHHCWRGRCSILPQEFYFKRQHHQRVCPSIQGVVWDTGAFLHKKQSVGTNVSPSSLSWQVAACDTTGAGDAFTAGFILKLLQVNLDLCLNPIFFNRENDIIMKFWLLTGSFIHSHTHTYRLGGLSICLATMLLLRKLLFLPAPVVQ